LGPGPPPQWRTPGARKSRKKFCVLGHSGESQQALDELIAAFGHRAAYQIGEVYAWRGEKDRSLEWLQRAYMQREEIQHLKVDPLLRKLRGDPRYVAPLKKINLPAD
jgi:hypothetical protein